MSALWLHIIGLVCGILLHYTSAQLSSEIRCDHLWEENNVSRICYQFHLQSFLSWNEARMSCQAQGGDLLSITNLEEEKYISKKLENADIMLWIGLNQIDRLSGWQWSDGSALGFLNWKDLPPFYRERKHCGTFYAGRENKWQSSRCESKLPYVCKKCLAGRHHLLYENWKFYPTQCEPNWIPYNRRCAKLQKKELSWSEASAACRSDGGKLWSVRSLADVEFLLNHLDQQDIREAWIGMSSKRKAPVMFQWSDGSAVTFTSWQRHEPNTDIADSDLCVSAQRADGNWKVRPCREKLFSVCQKPGLSRNMTADESCEENWVRHGDYCYGTNSNNESFSLAANVSTYPLAFITNRFEQAFINSLISSKIIPGEPYFWIGLNDFINSGEYKWRLYGIKKWKVSYTNWGNQEPRYNGGCVVLSTGPNLGHWEVKDCEIFLARSLCKKPLRNEIEIDTKPHKGIMSQECVAPWETKPGLQHCYKVFHHEKLMRKRTWREAEDLCQDFGADLVSLSNFQEKQFVEELLSTMYSGNETRKFWTGLNKQNPSQDSWEWSDGSPVVSSFLNNLYPENVSGNCAAYRTDMRLVPLNCNTQEEWICKIPKGVKPKTPDWHLKQLPWVFFQGHNYFFSLINMNFDVAKFMCDMTGSAVTSILTEAEQAFIHKKVKQMSKENQRLWIGLKSESDGSLRWEDGSSVEYTNWKTQPQSNMTSSTAMRDGYCVYMESDSGLWDFVNCQSPYPTICKTNVLFKIEEPYVPMDNDQEYGICPEDWLHYGKKCFFVNQGAAMNWYMASNFCREHGGRLATISNEIEHAFIVMQLFGEKRSFWIGLQQKDYALWENGNVQTYNNWIPTQHIHKDQEHLCAILSTYDSRHQIGKWYLDSCHSSDYGFICEKELDISNPAFHGPDMYPVSDTMEYGHKTYRIISGNLSWHEASIACQESGDNLASITDQYHQAFVTILVHRLGYPHWIGSYSANSRDDFRWIDGSLSLFASWADDASPSDGSCVYIDTNGYWRAEDCDSKLQGALCLPSVGSTDLHHPGCPEQWIPFQDFCYSIYTVLHLKEFHEAEEACKDQGGDILTIFNEEEEAFIHYEVKTFTSVQSIWLDRITPLSKGEVAWSDGSIVNYSQWSEETMDGNGLGDYCLSMWMDDGTWRTAPCHERRGFICKKEGHSTSNDTLVYTETNHFIIPVAVVSAVVISILLILSWYLVKQKRFLSRPETQTPQRTQPGPQPHDVELRILIKDSNDREK